MNLTGASGGVTFVKLGREQLGPEFFVGQISLDQGEELRQRVRIAGGVDAATGIPFVGGEDFAMWGNVAGDYRQRSASGFDERGGKPFQM